MGEPSDAGDEAPDHREQRARLTEVGIGITLAGVIFNTGLTIGFGLSSSPLYVRLPLALGVPVLLLVALGILTRRVDLLGTMPWWLTRHGPDPWERLKRD